MRQQYEGFVRGRSWVQRGTSKQGRHQIEINPTNCHIPLSEERGTHQTLWKVNKDFTSRQDGHHRLLQKFVDMKSLVDEMTGEEEGTYNHSGIIDIVRQEKGLERKKHRQ
mmetsp:Transcript_32593/g.68419  ORF Transcript_32593/g.68419 Transcript_32593/m.68419 type:complete len:110 (+) Transcript_32593:217-546(+)